MRHSRSVSLSVDGSVSCRVRFALQVSKRRAVDWFVWVSPAGHLSQDMLCLNDPGSHVLDLGGFVLPLLTQGQDFLHPSSFCFTTLLNGRPLSTPFFPRGPGFGPGRRARRIQ